MTLLKFFQISSGLKVKFNKSELSGINLGREQCVEWIKMIGCRVKDLPIQYLGLPLGSNPKTLHFWNRVIEKISKRVGCWKGKMLSKGGKLIFLLTL